MYSLLRPLLFRLDPERAHDLTMLALSAAGGTGLLPKIWPSPPAAPISLMGLNFPNRVGLAAGLDKNARCLSAWQQLGFGFVEVGTLTPRPQAGNPRPRMFRIPEAQALINRMGFNNEGVIAVATRCRAHPFDGVLGVNIGKNRDTPAEQALADYCACMDAVYSFASYITVNVSSPNTPGLRHLQYGEALDQLLSGLIMHREGLRQFYGRQVPLLLKIAPDLEDREIELIAGRVQAHAFDGIIATNTTISREAVSASALAKEAGGLSGAPLRDASLHILKTLRGCLGHDFPVISVGGIMTGEDAADRIAVDRSDLSWTRSGGGVHQAHELTSGYVHRCRSGHRCDLLRGGPSPRKGGGKFKKLLIPRAPLRKSF